MGTELLRASVCRLVERREARQALATDLEGTLPQQLRLAFATLTSLHDFNLYSEQRIYYPPDIASLFVCDDFLHSETADWMDTIRTHLRVGAARRWIV